VALTPRMHIAPPHPLGLQYAPHLLAASESDTVLSGGEGKGIKRPVVGFLLLIQSGLQLAARAADQSPGWIGSYQGDDPRAFRFREPRLAPGTRAITKSPSIPSALKRWIRSRTV
jgi:hypothetical protein